MFKFLSAALFVSLAAAEVTVTAWMPGMPDSGVTYVGSVISVSGDRTVVSMGVQDVSATESDYGAGAPETVTLGGATYVEFQAAATQSDVAVTISAECSRSNTDDLEATCTMTTSGLDDALSSLSSLCAGPQSNADYCTDAMDIATEMTTILPEGYFGAFPLIVTAGEDLLPSASAAATPSASSATPTGSIFSRVSSTTSASGSESGSASGTSAIKSSAASAASVVEQSTAGAPMMTMAPAVAALGAAAAFFL